MTIEIRAEVPGTVLKLAVAEGNRVAAGDTLLLLESMKMEIPIDAPRSGVVARVSVAEAQVITEGQVLMVLD